MGGGGRKTGKVMLCYQGVSDTTSEGATVVTQHWRCLKWPWGIHPQRTG